MSEHSYLFGPSMNELHRLQPRRKMTDDEYFAHLRETDPESIWLSHISCAWTDLNREYERNGISEEFKYLRKRLKLYITKYRPRVSDARWREFLDMHPDRRTPIIERGKIVRVKFEHGYNLNYDK